MTNKLLTLRDSFPVVLSTPVRLLALTYQGFGEDALHVPPTRRAGGVDEALSLLFGPIPRADPRCASSIWSRASRTSETGGSQPLPSSGCCRATSPISLANLGSLTANPARRAPERQARPRSPARTTPRHRGNLHPSPRRTTCRAHRAPRSAAHQKVMRKTWLLSGKLQKKYIDSTARN